MNTTPNRGSDRLDESVRDVCQAVGDFIEAWGFKSIHGRVWALLAIRSAPLSQTEIAEFLRVSRSLVNLAISELEGHGLVRSHGTHRNAPYEARLDVWPTITDVLRSREWMLMERARVTLEAAVQEFEWCKSHGFVSDFDVQRLKLLLLMTEFAQATLRAVLGIRVPRAIDELGGWLRTGAGYVQKLQDLVGLPR